ncbi:hypothetical protein AB0395_35135 [Streptosporangium sp. NPDC051023]|uniref:hypothetical protein n=1 Tax=Streptosporangium sp. NPDC051023 TaxID=3155410 RepID=UPI0034500572
MRRLEDAPRRNAPPGHIEREMTRLIRSREHEGEPVWDLPHGLVAVHWDGQRMWAGEKHIIPLSVLPDAIPEKLMRLAGQETEPQRDMIEAGQQPTLYAFMLVSESHKVLHDPRTATEFDAVRMRRDRVERRFRERADAIETCDVMAADIDRRFWMAERRRDLPRRISRRFWPGPDAGCISKDKDYVGAQFPGGQFVRTVVGLAMTTAVMLHGDRLPSPAGSGAVIPLRGGRHG